MQRRRVPSEYVNTSRVAWLKHFNERYFRLSCKYFQVLIQCEESYNFYNANIVKHSMERQVKQKYLSLKVF
jgi:hypothetical protein